MSMKTFVYVLTHSSGDYDDYQAETRGIYATREAAEADLPVEGIEYPDHCETRRHDDGCCWISEHAVEDRPLRVGMLAPKPVPTLRGDPLLSSGIADAIRASLVKHAPFDRPLARLEEAVASTRSTDAT